MAAFEVNIDAAKSLLVLRNGGRRLAYALVNTLNETAREIQKAERAHMRQTFTIRDPNFMNRMIAVIKFASVSQGRYEAKVSVGQRKRLLLGQFEEGGIRQPARGARTAIPVIGGARPQLAAAVPEDLWIQRLQLHAVSGRGRRGEVEGLLGTFLIRALGILQRLPGGGNRLLYLFKAGVRIPARLQWYYIAEHIAQITAPRRLRSEVDDSFRHTSLSSSFSSLVQTGTLA